VRRPFQDVDAGPRALAGRVDHVQVKAPGDFDAAAWGVSQVAVAVFDVGQPVDVELEDLRDVPCAQPVSGAQILIDPDVEVFCSGRHGSSSPRSSWPCHDRTRRVLAEPLAVARAGDISLCADSGGTDHAASG
jgi:hypothetical protein